jgi:hypothetical protein
MSKNKQQQSSLTSHKFFVIDVIWHSIASTESLLYLIAQIYKIHHLVSTD